MLNDDQKIKIPKGILDFFTFNPSNT